MPMEIDPTIFYIECGNILGNITFFLVTFNYFLPKLSKKTEKLVDM